MGDFVLRVFGNSTDRVLPIELVNGDTPDATDRPKRPAKTSLAYGSKNARSNPKSPAVGRGIQVADGPETARSNPIRRARVPAERKAERGRQAGSLAGRGGFSGRTIPMLQARLNPVFSVT